MTTITLNPGASLIIDAAAPYDRQSARSRVRAMLDIAGGDAAVVRRMILVEMRAKYLNFNAKKHPGRREYDALRKALNDFVHLN